jgi:hypothetical protein
VIGAIFGGSSVVIPNRTILSNNIPSVAPHFLQEDSFSDFKYRGCWHMVDKCSGDATLQERVLRNNC